MFVSILLGVVVFLFLSKASKVRIED